MRIAFVKDFRTLEMNQVLYVDLERSDERHGYPEEHYEHFASGEDICLKRP